MGQVTEQTIEQRLKNAGPGLNVGLTIGLIGVLDLIIVLTITWFVAPRAAIPAALFVVVFPPLVLWAILQLTWAPMARRYPARPQSPDAVVKKSQSFVFGRLGRYNNCVHIAVDEHSLHLIPPSVFRLCGAKVISLPWDAMHEVGRPSAFGMVRAKIDGRVFAGPTWCMELAHTEPSS